MNKLRVVIVGASLLCLLVSLSLVSLPAIVSLQREAKQGELLDALVYRLRHGRDAGDAGNALRPADQTPAGPDASPLIQERVELPNLEGRFWLTFLYHDGWQADAETVRLHNMFLNDSRLVEMRSRCRVNSFGNMEPYMVQSWRKYVGDNTPMLVLQAPDGRLCFKTSRGNIPQSADECVSQLQAAINTCFRRPCPQPLPQPQPTPEPAPLQPVSPLPDTVQPAELPTDSGDPLWLLAVLGIGGATGGMWWGRKRR